MVDPLSYQWMWVVCLFLFLFVALLFFCWVFLKIVFIGFLKNIIIVSGRVCVCVCVCVCVI